MDVCFLSTLLILGECQNDATFYSSSDLGITWTTLGTVPMLTGLTALTRLLKISGRGGRQRSICF